MHQLLRLEEKVDFLSGGLRSVGPMNDGQLPHSLTNGKGSYPNSTAIRHTG